MTRILYVEASPRKNRSASIEVAHAALAAWSDIEPDLSVDVLDPWSMELPEFDGPVMMAKYAGLAGTTLTPQQAEAWAQVSAIGARFLAADVILLAVPLWNFSIPYKLKQLIDVVSQKDLLFTFDGQGFSGLLRGRKALLVLARGLDYAPTATTPADTYDFQRPYLEMWLRYIGITDITTVVVEKTLIGPDIDHASRATAKQAAVDAVKQFAQSSSRVATS